MYGWVTKVALIDYRPEPKEHFLSDEPNTDIQGREHFYNV